MRRLDAKNPSPHVGRLIGTWLALLLLGAAEFGVSFLPIGHALRPLIMVPGIFMILLVTVGFMEVRQGPTIVRAFAVAAAFWLLILLVLGSADPLTRLDHYVSRVEAGAEH